MPENLTLYVAGPMRGLPNFNFATFDAARDFIANIGHTPISPADHDRELDFVTDHNGVVETTDKFDIHEVMRWDLEQVVNADGIFLLPGWENSEGVGHELNAARATGKRVFHFLYAEVLPDSPAWGRDGWVERDGRRFLPHMIEERPPIIIGISGYAQAGKDTAALTLTGSAGFLRCAFADALRDMLYALNPSLFLGGGTYAQAQFIVDQHGWEWAKANSSARELLQRLGTEAGREVLGDDIWVRTAMSKVQPGGKYVFTDVRFPNEAKAIKDAGGQVWRVERAGTAPVNAHPSETALDDWPFDYVIFNGGTIEELAEQVGHLIHPQRYIPTA